MTRRQEWTVIVFCLFGFMMSALMGVFVADHTQPLPTAPTPSVTYNVYKIKAQVQKVADAATSVAKSMDK